MLTAKLIHDWEKFPSPLVEKGVVFAIDIIPFHQAKIFWDNLNKKYNLSISYFDDTVIRSHIIKDLMENKINLFNLIIDHKLREEIFQFFEFIYKKQIGFVFICD